MEKIGNEQVIGFEVRQNKRKEDTVKGLLRKYLRLKGRELEIDWP